MEPGDVFRVGYPPNLQLPTTQIMAREAAVNATRKSESENSISLLSVFLKKLAASHARSTCESAHSRQTSCILGCTPKDVRTRNGH